jgi:hypothetical protein
MTERPKVRAAAWVVLIGLAAIQAWATRFYATPDGVSYMDMSDAVLTGQWRELLNAYWSPLYPALIGILRLMNPSAYWEFAFAHVVNVFLFIGCLSAFEYLIAPLRELGRTRWDKPGLSTGWGTAGAYAIFGAFTLIMTPLTLPTPDLLVSATVLVVFGALLRLWHDIEPRRSGIVLGLALAAGSLAKSFIIPWAGICIITALVAVRGRSLRPALIATSIWLAAVLPWTAALSAKYGHLTFGDTGRLTYVWYVNRVETPSLKLMPHAAATPITESAVRGVAITPNASGTNPIWYDPARWYQDLHPRFQLSRQLTVIGILGAEYIASLAPILMVLAFWLVGAGGAGVREWWSRVWPIVVPAVAALVAYSIVLVTTRYVAPFCITITLAVICGARWPERISAGRMAAAVGVPLVAMFATPLSGPPVALINTAIATVPFVWMMRHRTLVVQVVVALLGAAAVRVAQPQSDIRLVFVTGVLLTLAFALIAVASDRRQEWATTSPVVRRTLVTACSALVLLVGATKYWDSLKQERPDPNEPNAVWTAAQRATGAGMRPNAKIALVGSPFDTYWARANRAQIVAVVPPPSMLGYWQTTPEQRSRLYSEFVRAGAQYLVVQRTEPPPGADRMWVAIPHIGWVRALQ